MTLRFVDCTLRDGGNVNAWAFTRVQVDRIVRGLDDAGVDVIEVGYYGGSGSHRAELVGPAGRCEGAFLADLPDTRAILGVMVVPSVCPFQELDLLGNTVVRLVRVASYPQDFDAGLAFISRLKDLGMPCVSANLMAASHVAASELPAMALRAESAGADLFCIADSFGALQPDAVREAIGGVGARAQIPVGFHGHNNLGLAFANAIAAIDAGATYLDGSLCGMARGAGNLATEQWMGAAEVWPRLPQTYDVTAALDVADFVRTDVLPAPPPASSIEIRMGIHDLHYYYWDLVCTCARQAGCEPDQVLRSLADRRPVRVDRKLVEEVVSRLIPA